MSLGLAGIPRNLKNSKHTGETSALTAFRQCFKAVVAAIVARVACVNNFQMFVLA